MKKRKLNSKNPRYIKNIKVDKVKERVLIQTAENFKVYAVYLEN